MKVLKRNYFLLLLCMSSLISCNNDTAPLDKIDTPNTSETVVVLEKKVPIDLTTIEGFWVILKEAIASKNKEKIKELTLPNVGASSLLEPDYQVLIANSDPTNIKKSRRMEAGKSMYEFVMTMNYEGVAEMDQPTTTIFIWKNEAGNFEIFEIFEAG